VAQWRPSPNQGPRRGNARPRLIVLHYTAMENAGAALDRLCDPRSEVSAHYLIGASGQLWQLVAEDRRAWHAGAGSWGGADDVNSRSIGVELANTGTHPFPEPQMIALEALLGGIMDRWKIRPEGVIGHADMAPTRKADPGPRFDWQRLARQGLSVWPEAAAAEGQGDFAASAARFGYPTEDAASVLRAFRDRFRPGAKGPESAADRRLLADLAARYPAAIVERRAGRPT
jgi:N-acetylmuramoyl-L-alanine amidase